MLHLPSRQALRRLEQALADPDFEQFTRTVLEQAGVAEPAAEKP
jgi:hypothetical protein